MCWFWLKIVGMFDFQTIYGPLWHRLISNTTTLQSFHVRPDLDQKRYFARFIFRSIFTTLNRNRYWKSLFKRWKQLLLHEIYSVQTLKCADFDAKLSGCSIFKGYMDPYVTAYTWIRQRSTASMAQHRSTKNPIFQSLSCICMLKNHGFFIKNLKTKPWKVAF